MQGVIVVNDASQAQDTSASATATTTPTPPSTSAAMRLSAHLVLLAAAILFSC
jgi:hypothetical protein